jgi:hypothetical protein
MTDVPDIEVGRYALRTFKIDYNRLELKSMTQGSSESTHWRHGTCEATCLIRNHIAPYEGCSCGIYGTLNLDSLIRQYAFTARDIVAVFAAEGKTIVGEVGLRTAAARVVAWWSPLRGVRRICEVQCEGAKKFDDLDTMLAAYGFPPVEAATAFKRPRKRRVSPIFSSALWFLWCLWFLTWDVYDAWIEVDEHRYELAWLNGGFSLIMVFLAWTYYRRLRARAGW